MNELIGYRLEASDGDFGKVRDFYFDNRQWIVRYLVADTGTWLPKRKVLISPVSIQEPDWNQHTVPVGLDRRQIESSPSIETDQPVSRRHETKLAQHHSWPIYWPSGAIPAAGVPIPPQAVLAMYEREEPPPEEEPEGESHLRSVNEVTSYRIHATDGEIGHVEDFIVDTEDWTIRYLVVDTRNWLPGKKVLLPPAWIRDVSWTRGQVDMDATRQKIKDAPKYDPSAPVNRQYELRLYDFYGMPRYWK